MLTVGRAWLSKNTTAAAQWLPFWRVCRSLRNRITTTTRTAADSRRMRHYYIWHLRHCGCALRMATRARCGRTRTVGQLERGGRHLFIFYTSAAQQFDAEPPRQAAGHWRTKAVDGLRRHGNAADTQQCVRLISNFWSAAFQVRRCA